MLAASDRPPTETQEQALAHIRELLRVEAARSWTSSAAREGADYFLPRIDDERRARVLLIDGERGSGKSTVLVTLLDELSRPFRNNVEPTADTLNVIPTQLLDFSPLPQATNLILHVGAAIYRVAEAIRTRDDDSDRRNQPPAWIGRPMAKPDAVSAWERFVEAAAAGWDGNVQQRGSRLDPETYATEVEETELKRLEVPVRFIEFVDAVIHGARRWLQRPGTPLLLVAIDDADMDPVRSPELLQVLRAFYHPRLVYLLTGDSALFRRMLGLHVRRALCPPEREPNQQLENTVTARQLAEDMYAKAIPPAQRYLLRPLDPKERMERFERWLEQSAKEHALSPPPSAKVLLDYLSMIPATRGALPSRLRTEVDIYDTLFKDWSDPHAFDETMMGVLAGLWEEALTRSGEWDETLLKMVKVDDGALVVSEEEGVLRLTAIRQIHTSGAPVRVVASRPDRWRLDRMDPTVVRRRGHQHDAAPTLLLCSIFAIEHPRGRFVTAPRGYDPVGSPMVWGQTSDANGKVVEFGWPTFSDQLLLDRALFAQHWSDLLTNQDSVRGLQDVDLLARRYLGGMISVLAERKPPVLPAAPKSWRELVEGVAMLVGTTRALPQPERRRELVLAWVDSLVGLLAAPESGLPATGATELLVELKSKFAGEGQWNEMKRALCASRRRRAENVLRHSLVNLPVQPADGIALLQGIDRTFPGHPWHAEVGCEAEDVAGPTAAEGHA